jgi:thymidylate synthase (FAD)
MKIVNQKVELVDSMGSDLSVVNAARVSFNKESEWDYEKAGPDEHGHYLEKVLSEKDQKLIAYLARHNHWSPFAHTYLQFRIKAPIFVARQLVKHQVGGVWNEVSRRYVADEYEYFRPVWRLAPTNAKQGSGGNLDDATARLADEIFWKSVESSYSAYIALLELGVAPEQARAVSTLNAMTEWYWTGSLMFFARVCKLRLDPHAQGETQEIAQLINAAIPKEFEHSWKALLA